MNRRAGRYRNNENKAGKRKHMSYEDVPLDDYRDDDPIPANLTKKFLKVFLILFLSVVALLALMNIDKLTPDNISHWFEYDLLGKSEGDGYPTGFSGTTVSTENFDLMNGVPIYCSDTSIVVLNSNAGKYQETQHAFANPIINVNSTYSIIYNADATGYTIVSRDEVIHTASTKNKIYSADVASNGVYGILTHNDDYLSKLNVYKKDNTEKYAYSFADYYVNNVSLNKDGTRAVVSGVSAKNGGLTSAIYVLDFNQKNYMQRYEMDDVYIYTLKYLVNGNAIAVGDKASYYIDIETGEKTDIGYQSKFLTAYTTDRDNGMLLSLSSTPDGRECEIVMIDETGERKAEIPTKNQIISMDYGNNKIAVLFSNETVIYNLKGSRLSEMKSATDSRKVRFMDDNRLYVLGKSKLYQVEIEY